MNTSIIKLSLLGLLTAAVAGMPSHLPAQDINGPTVEHKVTKRKARTLPLHGKLKVLDLEAKTLTIGKQVIHITPETKFKRAGEVAKLEDGIVGEETMVLYRKTADGTKQAVKVRFGPKVGKGRKKAKARSQPAE